MTKMLAIFILAVYVISCRTMIDPGTKHAPRTLEEMDKAVEKNHKRVIVHTDKKQLTKDEMEELKRRYFRHNNPTLNEDITIVTDADNECTRDSDWICPISPGVWACYCKLNKKRVNQP